MVSEPSQEEIVADASNREVREEKLHEMSSDDDSDDDSSSDADEEGVAIEQSRYFEESGDHGWGPDGRHANLWEREEGSNNGAGSLSQLQQQLGQAEDRRERLEQQVRELEEDKNELRRENDRLRNRLADAEAENAEHEEETEGSSKVELLQEVEALRQEIDRVRQESHKKSSMNLEDKVEEFLFSTDRAEEVQAQAVHAQQQVQELQQELERVQQERNRDKEHAQQMVREAVKEAKRHTKQKMMARQQPAVIAVDAIPGGGSGSSHAVAAVQATRTVAGAGAAWTDPVVGDSEYRPHRREEQDRQLRHEHEDREEEEREQRAEIQRRIDASGGELNEQQQMELDQLRQAANRMRCDNQKMQGELKQRDAERRMLRLTQDVVEPAPGNSASHSRGSNGHRQDGVQGNDGNVDAAFSNHHRSQYDGNAWASQLAEEDGRRGSPGSPGGACDGPDAQSSEYGADSASKRYDGPGGRRRNFHDDDVDTHSEHDIDRDAGGMETIERGMSRSGESANRPSSFYFSPHDGERGVAVYLIVRGSVRDGAGQSFTFRDKRTDEFVLFAVRMKNRGAAKVKARYSPLRFYSSTKAEHAGELDDTNQYYMGKLKEENDATGTNCTLFRCKPNSGALANKKERKQAEQAGTDGSREEHASIKVELKSKLKVPKPREIRVKLTGPNAHQRKRLSSFLLCSR